MGLLLEHKDDVASIAIRNLICLVVEHHLMSIRGPLLDVDFQHLRFLLPCVLITLLLTRFACLLHLLNHWTHANGAYHHTLSTACLTFLDSGFLINHLPCHLHFLGGSVVEVFQ